MVWACFVHRTSRPSKEDRKPDPQLHAHVTVFNATFDAAEGQWKATQHRDLKRDAPYWQAAFHARLARGLAALGYAVERRGKDWGIASVSPALCRKFSRRNVEIAQLADELGLTDPAAKAALGATSRLNKVDASIDSLRAYWGTAAIRELRKRRGQLGAEREVPRLVPLNRTEAERADPHTYAGGEVIQFGRNARGHVAGSRLGVVEPAAVPVRLAERFQVYRAESLTRCGRGRRRTRSTL